MAINAESSNILVKPDGLKQKTSRAARPKSRAKSAGSDTGFESGNEDNMDDLPPLDEVQGSPSTQEPMAVAQNAVDRFQAATPSSQELMAVAQNAVDRI